MLFSDTGSVAEIQGYYGSLNIAEKVIQKLWEHQELNASDFKTKSGELIEILHPGQWNHHEGPDFKDARIRIGSESLSGDIELHFYPRDWKAHGHSRDSTFRNVILHVTLFDGDPIVGFHAPQHHLVLLPYLKDDLESLFTRYALNQSEVVAPEVISWAKGLFELQGKREAQHQLLVAKAQLRWHLKKKFAEARMLKNGWMESCHQTTMEVLGYRRNRRPMHLIAEQYPLEEKCIWFPTFVYDAYMDMWKLKGLRPANHPLRRLVAYRELLDRLPEWPGKVFEIIDGFSGELLVEVDGFESSNIAQMRKELRLSELVKTLKTEVFIDAIGETRLLTLLCDALLPLYAEKTGVDMFAAWLLLRPGDYPEVFSRVLQSIDLSNKKGAVRCNGWLQGCLQLMLEKGN